MAWQDYAETITVMERTLMPDGLGGFEEKWTEGVQFKGTLRTSNNIQTLIAEQQGVTGTYLLLYPNTLPLRYGDILKKDNRFFRINSEPEDGKPPTISTLDFISVTLEHYNMV